VCIVFFDFEKKEPLVPFIANADRDERAMTRPQHRRFAMSKKQLELLTKWSLKGNKIVYDKGENTLCVYAQRNDKMILLFVIEE